MSKIMLTIHDVFNGVMSILKMKKYAIAWMVCSLGIFAILFYLPVKLIRGNDLLFQASLLKLSDYLLLLFFSLLSGLSIVMNVRIWQNKKSRVKSIKNAAVGSIGTSSGLLASLFIAPTCSLCIGGLFSFLGAGSVLFLVEKRWFVITGGLALLLLSIVFSARVLSGSCAACKTH